MANHLKKSTEKYITYENEWGDSAGVRTQGPDQNDPARDHCASEPFYLHTQIVQNYIVQTIAKTLQGWHVPEYNEINILVECRKDGPGSFRNFLLIPQNPTNIPGMMWLRFMTLSCPWQVPTPENISNSYRRYYIYYRVVFDYAS